MADNASTLVLSAKEEVSVAANRAADALEKYTVALGEVTKADAQAMASLSKVAAQYSSTGAAATRSGQLVISAATKQTAAYRAWTDAATAATAAQERLNAVTSATSARASAAVVGGVSTVRAAPTNTGLAAANGAGGVSAISAENAAQADRYAAALADVSVSEGAAVAAGNELATTNVRIAAATDSATVSNIGFAASFGSTFENVTQTRHALTAASTALATMGAGLIAIPVLTAIVAKDFQSDFASVSRALVGDATPQQLAAIKDQLLALSETTPTSFKNLTAIAAAGAQMGIAAPDIIAFTKTVADLTITTTVSAAAAESFIRKFQLIAGVGSAQFANLTSALLNVGIHTGATEAQIAVLATQIIGIGKVAGLTVPQIIGISAAFASINSTGPSRARGTIVRAFTDIQKAITDNGPALNSFASVAGVTADTVTKAFGTPKFANIFVDFLKGLDQVQKEGGNTVAVLNGLGITSTVDIPLLQNAAGAYKLFGTALKDANAGYADAGILALHYNVINATVASKTKDLTNTFGVLANSIGGAAIPALTNLVTVLEQGGKALEAFASTPGGANTLTAFAWVAVVTGVLLLLVSVLTRVGAAILSIGQAAIRTRDFIVSMQVAMAATADTAGILGAAMDLAFGPVGLTIATAAAAVAAFGLVLNSLRAPDSSIQAALQSTTGSYSNLVKTVTQGDNVKDFITTTLGGASTTSAFGNLDKALNTSNQVWKNYAATIFNTNLADANTAFLNDTKKIGDILATLSGTNLPAAQQGFDQLAKKTDGSETELSRLLDVMPGYKSALDTMLTANGQMTTSQNEVALATGASTDKVKAAQDAIKQLTDANAKFASDLNASLGGIGSTAITKLTTAYTKSLAPLTDFNTAVSDVQNAQTKALSSTATTTQQQDAQNVSLSALTKQYVTNGQQAQTWATNLVIVAQKYGQGAANQFIAAGFSAVNQSVLAQLAGAAPAQGLAFEQAQTAALNAASTSAAQVLISAGNLMVVGGGKISDKTAAEMGAQLVAGFSPAAIMKEFNLQFGDNPATPVADTKPADTSIKKLLDKYDGVKKPNVKPSADLTGITEQLNKFLLPRNLPVHITLSGTIPGNVPGGGGSSQSSGGYSGGYAMGNNRFGYAGGGFTGYGGKYQPAGIVHRGEFVVTQEATRALGVRNLYRMMKQAQGGMQAPYRGGYASGGLVTGGAPTVSLDLQSLLGGHDGPLLVQLDPYSQGLLRAIANGAGKPAIGPSDVASAQGTANKTVSNRGT